MSKQLQLVTNLVILLSDTLQPAGSENGTAARSEQSLDSLTLAAADSVPQAGEGHPSLASDSSEFLSATSSQ